MDLKLGHHAKDGIEVIDVQGEIDMYTAPRLSPDGHLVATADRANTARLWDPATGEHRHTLTGYDGPRCTRSGRWRLARTGTCLPSPVTTAGRGARV